ncbi:MAG: dTMP kinase [Elusimicrobia bacterium]|nr:dTMP kinase [Elusimicrobiota bacterium]
MKRHQGLFITFEGSEGCGKSTQSKMLLDHLEAEGVLAVLLREPGGVKISEKVREILLDKKNTAMTKECETLLYMAARAQLVEEALLPELKKGKVVILDRFLDSTVAYQGYGCGVDAATIRAIGLFATQGVQPDVTFFLDLDAAEGLRRRGSERDRIEERALEYHQRVRRGYQAIAEEEPARVVQIDGKLSKESIFEIIRKRVDLLLREKGHA